jgi:hypothetical protein
MSMVAVLHGIIIMVRIMEKIEKRLVRSLQRDSQKTDYYSNFHAQHRSIAASNTSFVGYQIDDDNDCIINIVPSSRSPPMTVRYYSYY